MKQILRGFTHLPILNLASKQPNKHSDKLRGGRNISASYTAASHNVDLLTFIISSDVRFTAGNGAARSRLHLQASDHGPFCQPSSKECRGTKQRGSAQKGNHPASHQAQGRTGTIYNSRHFLPHSQGPRECDAMPMNACANDCFSNCIDLV